MNDMMMNILGGAAISALLAWTLYLVIQISYARGLRPSTERRLGVLESDVKELREMYGQVVKISTLLEQIQLSQEKNSNKLDGLSEWQIRHEQIIEDAAKFITEIRSDGTRVKT